LVGGSDGWWIDTGASHHVCYERAMFRTYTAAEDQKVLLEIPTPLKLLESEMWS
jgi:hypothetical protein